MGNYVIKRNRKKPIKIKGMTKTQVHSLIYNGQIKDVKVWGTPKQVSRWERTYGSKKSRKKRKKRKRARKKSYSYVDSWF